MAGERDMGAFIEVDVDCPGTASNAYALVSGEWKCRYGISDLRNTGECRLFISPFDESGAPHEKGRYNVTLDPGVTIPHYYPPQGTHSIVVVCDKTCEARGRCQYSTPNA